MLAGRRIGPFAGGAGTGVRAVEPDIEAAARMVARVADDPVAATAGRKSDVATKTPPEFGHPFWR
jgi:hypothetical protein